MSSKTPARPRLSKSSPLSENPFFALNPAKADPHTPITKLAGLTLANHVIRQMLSDSEAFHHALANGEQAKAGLRPLNSTQTDGLHAALHFLRQEVDAMNSERDG